MRGLKLCIIAIIITAGLFAQNNPEAVKILDRFSSAALGAPSVTMIFNLITTDQGEGSSDTINGSVIISKDKYKIELPDNNIWFNGETSWNYLSAEKEVTIAKPDRNDNSFQSRPSSIFSLYKKGYKIRLIEERSDSYTIDLYPEDNKSDFIRIRLTLGKSSPDLKSIEYKKKDGIIIALKVREYNLKQRYDASTFIFSPEKYKDVEIIDMR